MIRRTPLISIVAFVLFLPTSLGQISASERHALLIGCSKYQSNDIRPLAGAENDVESFRKLLSEQFEFEDVVTLVGWPDEEAKRPTYSNITAAFQRLIEDAKPDCQIVVVMAGHGFRFPLPESQVDVLDPSNPEPDGLDEAFLPADYHAQQNMILDNQIGIWLDELKSKGAHVWIVFDSCFSGTMTRGAEEEGIRELSPAEAGVSLESIKSAQRRAAESATGTLASHNSTIERLDVGQNKHSAGSVVAFYAAQNFETAPEVTRPKEADTENPEFKHGLLSYHLNQLLLERSGRITYADLGRALVGRYRADGRRRPTPFWEGDLDREVLGLETWPQPKAMFLERVADRVRLTGGGLVGLSKDTVVAVYEPSDKDFENPIGHVSVTEVSPTAAFVEAVAFGEHQRHSLDSLPDASPCRIVSRNLGDTRIKLRLESLSEESPMSSESGLGKAIRSAASTHDAVFQVVENSKEADWSFVVMPSGGQKGNPAAVLLPVASVDQFRGKREEESANWKEQLSNVPHSLFSDETLAEPEQLAKSLADDLQKIHVWHNIWRLAGEYTAPSPLVPRQEIHLDMRSLDGPSDTSSGKRLASSQLVPGDGVMLRIVNTGYQSYWYVVFYLNGRLGIQHVKTDSIRGRNFQDSRESEVEHVVLRFGIDPDSIGTNGFVVIAVSQKEHIHRPNYGFLAQSGLGRALSRSSANTSNLKTPFERLLLHSLAGSRETFRSGQSPDSPQIASWSWVTAPTRPAP